MSSKGQGAVRLVPKKAPEKTKSFKEQFSPFGSEAQSLMLRFSPLLFGAIIALLTMFASTPVMRYVDQFIGTVQVEGQLEYLTKDQVKRVLHPHLQVSFFDLDLETIQQALIDQPWVKNATVRRQWPDMLQVRLEEHRPVARWQQDGLISEEGDVFKPNNLGSFEALPVLGGRIDSAAEVMQQYLAISQLLRSVGLRVKKLSLSDSGSWKFTVDHVEVQMGRDWKMERLARFLELYHDRLAKQWSRVERVDLRYLNGAAVVIR